MDVQNKMLSWRCSRALTCCVLLLLDSRRAMLRHIQLLPARIRRARHSNGHIDLYDPVLLPIQCQQIRILLFNSHRASFSVVLYEYIYLIRIIINCLQIRLYELHSTGTSVYEYSNMAAIFQFKFYYAAGRRFIVLVAVHVYTSTVDDLHV